MQAVVSQWLRVTRQRPCAICHKADWCTYSSDGRVASCMRVEGEKRLRNGGWLHRVGDGGAVRPRVGLAAACR